MPLKALLPPPCEKDQYAGGGTYKTRHPVVVADICRRPVEGPGKNTQQQPIQRSEYQPCWGTEEEAENHPVCPEQHDRSQQREEVGEGSPVVHEVRHQRTKSHYGRPVGSAQGGTQTETQQAHAPQEEPDRP